MAGCQALEYGGGLTRAPAPWANAMRNLTSETPDALPGASSGRNEFRFRPVGDPSPKGGLSTHLRGCNRR